MFQVFYYKVGQFYYKMQQRLQITRTLLQNVTVIAKGGFYYKLPPYTVIFVVLYFVSVFYF